ncbi:MAG: hypothetical protein GXP31_11320 [Kiritimatiellaeota bacterium]|nr:hypothetical protein [Kiritimatiellota bacterium]
MQRFIGLAVAFLVPAVSCFAWSGFDVTHGPLRLVVDPLGPITDPSRPTTVRVRLENTGKTPVGGRVVLRDFVDAWHAVGPEARPVQLAAGAKKELEFAIASGAPVYSALYPVHAFAEFAMPGGPVSLHAVRIFEVRLEPGPQSAATAPQLPVVDVPADGCAPLWVLDSCRMAWRYFDGPMVWKPVGWRGSDPQSRASFLVRTAVRGARRPAINMHPPWRPGGGTVFCDFRLRLPDRGPISLNFANAIRDNTAKEPPSDGVLFRVWVGVKPDGSDARPVFERFTAAKVWIPGQVDLTPWAGKTILLRLESNPGPNRDTTCDSSYWAEPVVAAGRVPPASPTSTAMPEDAARAADIAARELLDGVRGPDRVRTFLLRSAAGGPSWAVVITPGRAGLLDAWFTVAGAGGTVRLHGLRLDIEDMPAVRPPRAYLCREVDVPRQSGTGGAVWRHRLDSMNGRTVVTCAVRADSRGLRIAVECPRRITSLSVGPWSRRARRVFYGHGYCIEDPKPFRAGFGGHNLATSHVGIEFGGGAPAMLQAVDSPPNAFVVSPEERIYALTTHMNAVLTLVPGASAFDCAVAYRPLYDKAPAGGVRRLAGRFCFDIWGGRYAEIAKRMAEMFRYGLTDSILTVHNWQRWGYDYRLPDVFPPNPAFGTIGDMRKIADVCTARDVPWGLHDNYIDFYPDAAGYSYRHVCFTPGGEPVKAWFNEGRDAQSYRWRPDRIMPFVRRNLNLIRENLRPTHYFLDVFTSAPPFDFRDADGRFHSSLETRRCWGEVFAWIRDTLGGNAPTTSEAGHDQLTGFLDGADCQWLSLSRKPKRRTIHVDCGDWERVPWFDAVNHRRFILHGVGYSVRYEGGRSRRFHGINSDDYLSAEVLSGHALMTDAGSWGRGAVRKYWFLQGVARKLALRTIRSVRFVGGDIHRQEITWDNGMVVRVNRGERDWPVGEHVLPRYGFLVQAGNGEVLAVLERRNGLWAESSRSGDFLYCNARTESSTSKRLLNITPRVEGFADAGGGRFRWTMVWDAQEPTPVDERVFVHFCGGRGKRDDTIAFQDDYDPPVPTSRWHGEIRIPRSVSVPPDAEGDYKVYVGMYGGGGGRVLLQGTAAGESRIWVATLHVRREADGTVKTAMTPPPPPGPRQKPRLNPPGTPVDFGFAATDGAFRLEKTTAGVRLTPLPGNRPFSVRLRPNRLGRTVRGTAVPSVAAWAAVPAAGAARRMDFTWKNGELTFRHDGRAFAYEIAW